MTPDAVKIEYRAMIDQRGEPVLLRRYTGAGANRPRFDTEVMAVVARYEPHELVGGILQGDRRIIVLAQDLIDRKFALPVVIATDRVVVRGKELAIIASDDSTRRVATALVAVEIQARG